jgi:hypothetical protein
MSNDRAERTLPGGGFPVIHRSKLLLLTTAVVETATDTLDTRQQEMQPSGALAIAEQVDV